MISLKHRSCLIALLCLTYAACSSTAPSGQISVEDPRGAVSLQAIADRSIQSSHPINLDTTLIARVLSGLHVQERQRVLQEMLAGSPSATPVFSGEQVQFLAPRIAKALTTATAKEAVTFLVTSPRQGSSRLESAVTETTAGSLYTYGLSLYVTLSRYRYAPGQANADSAVHRRLPDSSGLADRTLHFTPSAAQRPEAFNRPIGKASTDRVVAIDYQMLQHAVIQGAVTERIAPQAERTAAPISEPRPGTGVSDTPSQTAETLAQRETELRTLKDLVINKDLELESLRKELQSIRKQLDSRPSGQDLQKRKTAPASTPQQRVP